MRLCEPDLAIPPASFRGSAVEPAQRSAPRRFAVGWAESEEDVREAQRLRYRIFAQEMAARLDAPPGTDAGLDVDRFDAFCEHLLVRAYGPGLPDRGAVVGTYRVLGPAQARRAGGYYSDDEFDLAPLAQLRPRTVELGRSCVHADWRLGGVIMAMWSALGHYMQRHGLDTMIGCASVSLNDGGRSARALWSRLRRTHLVDPRWRVRPRVALPLRLAGEQHGEGAPAAGALDAPPLIKGYLRCGARLLGPPALDAAFNTADLPMMLHVADAAPRYSKHFLRGG